MADSGNRLSLLAGLEGRMLTITEVCDILRVSPRTIRRGWKTGRFPPPITVVGSQRWLGADIIAYLDVLLEGQETGS